MLTSIPNYPKGKYYDGYGVFKKRTEIYKGINIHRLPVIPRGNGSSLMLSLSYLSYVFVGLFYSLFLIRKNYDLVFVFEPSPITVAIPAILIKKLSNVPLCIWVLDLWPESVSAAGNLKTDIIPKLLLPVVRFIYKHSDIIMVSSKGFINSISEKGVDKDKIIYFPQWSEELFESRDFSSKDNKKLIPDGFVVMFAGNIGEAQDFPSVINAAIRLKQYRDIHWVILGSGRKETWLKEAIIRNNLEENFHLLGQFPIEKVPEFYSYADVLFISLKREDIFALTVPAKLQTYLASGKPILTMLDGEASSIVKESKSGLNAESGDSKLFADNILKMKQMTSSDLKQFGNNGFDYYKEYFKSDVLIDRAEKIFISMTKEQKA